MKKNKIRGKPARSYKNSGYDGGGASFEKNTLKQWQPQHYSAKLDLDFNLKTLRDRAFDLTINSPLGCAAIQTETTGVLGAGLRVFPQLKFKELGLSAEAAREWSCKTKLEFEMWAESLDCDYYRRNNFYEMQRIAFMSYLTDGDSFCLFRRRVPTFDAPYSLRLQILESQRISNPLTAVNNAGISQVEMVRLNNDNRIINGIEVDKNGKLVAIWVCNRIWNEPLTNQQELKWRRVRFFGKETGTRNILHICYDTRAEQFRGAPFLAPVIETLKSISRYGDAELTSAVIKSFFSIFFVQPQNNFEFNDILPNEENRLPVDVREYSLGSGTISALPRGVDVKAIDRSNAQSTFDPFMTSFIKQIGAALNIPYEILTKQFQASYSASRAALLQAQDEFRIRKASFVNDFCAPVYETFLTEAVAQGRIKAAGFFDDPLKKYLWCAADWRNEQTHSLDPTKEVEAAVMKIEAGLSTRAKEAVELGGSDFWENIEQLELENKLLDKVTIKPPEETAQNGKTTSNKSNTER